MKKAYPRYRSMLAAMAALALVSAAPLAGAAPLGKNTEGRSSYDNMAAAQNSAAPMVTGGAGADVTTPQQPLPASIGPNPGDLPRAQIQAEPQPLPTMPKAVTKWVNSMTSSAAQAATAPLPERAPMYGRQGFDPSLARLQDTPQSLPWSS